jgi:hypothetical protein
MIQPLRKKISFFFDSLLSRIDWKCVGAVSIAFIISRLMIVVVVYFSMAQIPVLTGANLWHYNPRNIIPDGLIRWDSGWYISIVQNGYSHRSTAFFPLYPLLIKIVSTLTGNIWTSGLWISNIAFLIALFYLYAIAKLEFDEGTAGRAVFYIAAAPAAFFFSTVYTESIFFLFSAAAFYYSLKKKWGAAAIFGALSSATRLAGILVALFIFFEALWQQGIRFIPKPWSLPTQLRLLNDDLHKFPKAWKGILASLVSTTGLTAYMVYLYQKFGDPLAFLHAEENWYKTISWDWPVRLVNFTVNMHKISGSIFSGGIGEIAYLMDTLFIIAFIPVVIIVFIKFRPSFGWFTVLSFIIPIVSGSPISMRRYVLSLLPSYLLLALWGKKTWVDHVIIGFSLPLQAYFLVLFSHWFFAG